MKLNGVDQPIVVQSSHVELGDALVEHAREHLKKLVSKWFNRLTNCTVHFKREGSFYECSITLKIGSLPQFVASASGTECHQAFNLASKRLGHQLETRKRELRDMGAQRAEKTLHNDGDLGLHTRKAPEVREPQPQGADDYAKALLQQDRQDRPGIASQDDARDYVRRRAREARRELADASDIAQYRGSYSEAAE